ncbi:DAK2 domain-containing protein [Salibacterium aidingense]|uniref:DAK2 domain-containing protein n=1 Tax=Salibacterium aidingense TaxID=384933 RepID=UPI0004261803|nr:DAK2 domain-containing protein [Salibacterium aidingense]
MTLSLLVNEYYEFIKKIKDELNQLDAAQGDGDLGNTMVGGAKALKVEAENTKNIPDWLVEGGKAFRKAAPSTMGILIASAMIKAGKQQKENNRLEWSDIQKTMIEEIMKRGKASRGDKTLLDAFIPAVNAFEEASDQGVSIALKEAASTAKAEAEKTKNLNAKTGRSSWMGDRAKGNMDGGAWLCYKTYQFLADWVKYEEKKGEKS